MQKRKKKRKLSLGTSLIYVVLSIWALTTIYPILWVVLNSFKVKDNYGRLLCASGGRDVYNC